ncbi:YgfZ/GcvT domain-containing protein, partial [Mycobacterium kiyosense]
MNPVPAPDPGPDAGAIWHFGDPLGEQRAAETAAVVVDRSHRAVLTLTGKDRQPWLHNISTQHVSDLPEGASTQNLSLDGQGRVEDHWLQTELGGTTYLDTEPWRGEPLLNYLRKMVFWSEVTVEAADLAVLSLIGPQLADRGVLDVLGLAALPDEWRAVPLAGGGFLRRVAGTPGGPPELDLLVPRAEAAEWRQRLT